MGPCGEEVGAAEKGRYEAGLGALVDLVGKPHLLNAARAHHGDAVGHDQGLLLVVGDEDEGGAKPPLELHELHPEVLAEPCVQGGEGLVQEEDLGLQDQGPGQGHPLLLPPGKLPGVALLQAQEVHELQRPGHLLPDGLRGRPFILRPKAMFASTVMWGKRA